MTDDGRPAPQYGEYATPEEAARRRGVPASDPVPPRPAAVTRQPDPAPAELARPRRPWDLLLTTALLTVGYVLTVQSIPGFLAFAATLTTTFAASGSDVEFGADADAVGIGLLVFHCALFLGAIGFSVARLRARRPAVWVPLVAGLLAVAADAVVPLVLIATNPAYASVLLNRP